MSLLVVTMKKNRATFHQQSLKMFNQMTQRCRMKFLDQFCLCWTAAAWVSDFYDFGSGIWDFGLIVAQRSRINLTVSR